MIIPPIKNLKLKTKISLIFSVFVVAISIFVLLYFTLNFDKIERQDFKIEFEKTTRLFSTDFCQTVPINSNEFFQKFKNNLKKNENLIYLVVRDNSRKVLLSYNLNYAVDHKYDKVDLEASEQNSAYKTSVPIIQEGIKTGTLYSGFSLKLLDEKNKINRINVLVVCLIIILFGLLTFYLLNSIITSSIRNLIPFEEAVGKNISAKANFEPSNEIEQLSSIFKKMVDNLENAYNEIEKVNRELEDRVIERTELLQQEIDEHKKTVERLNKSEISTRALLDAIPDLIFVFNKDGYFLKYKSESTNNFIMDTGKIVGKHVFDVFPKAIADDMIKSINNTIESGRLQQSEYQLEIDGEKKLYEARFVSIDQDEVLTIIRDITERKLSEIILKENESKFRALAETIPSAMFIICGSNFIYLNPGSEYLTDFSQRELLEMNFWDLVRRDNQEVVKQRMLEIQKGNEYPQHFEFPIVTKSNHIKWVDFVGKQINFKGKPAIIGIAIDVTERRKIDEKIRKLSLAVEHSSASIVITDVNGIIEYVNPKFVEVSGYSFKEAVGKNPSFLKSGMTSKEEYENLWTTIKDGKEWKGEFLNKKKNGEFVWESASISCIKNINGDIINYLAVNEDITEHKLVEEKLIQSEKDYRGLFENAHDAIIVLNPVTDKILTANPTACKIFGKSRDELEQTLFSDINFDSDHKKIFMENVQKNYLLKDFELVYYRTKITKFYLELNATVVRYKGEKAIILMIRDITDRKQFENSLFEAKEEAENANPDENRFSNTNVTRD